MAKREFHIFRDESGTLDFGVCMRCRQRFSPAGEIWGRIEDYLWRKFNEHKCKPEDANESTATNLQTSRQ